MISENAACWILLTQALGYNNPKFKKLAEMYSDISVFIKGGEKEWKLCGILTASDIEKLGAVKMKDAEAVIEQCSKLRYSVIALDDANYPDCLYQIYAPPAVIYISGTLPDMDNRFSLGIVGTRRASRYGTENSYKFAYALAKYGAVIVSGGALGVDCASHRGALAADGVTVCVRGCGINCSYLKDNEKMRQAITVKGAVISEYPPDEQPRGYYFPARNRIIAAFSDSLLLIEAGAKSGSLITADLALEMGKDIFALLGSNSPNNEGSNFRIKEGTAIPVTDFMDILVYYEKKKLFAADIEVDFNKIRFSDINSIPVKRGKTREGSEPPAPKQKTVTKKTKRSENNKEETLRTEPAASEAPKPARKDVHLEGDAERIYNCLSAEPVHIDTIAGDLGLPVNRVLSTLTLLEVQGLVRALKGRNFVLN